MRPTAPQTQTHTPQLLRQKGPVAPPGSERDEELDRPGQVAWPAGRGGGARSGVEEGESNEGGAGREVADRWHEGIRLSQRSMCVFDLQ